MVSLVLEGGTFRPIFSAGVMDALLDNNIIFPYCILSATIFPISTIFSPSFFGFSSAVFFSISIYCGFAFFYHYAALVVPFCTWLCFSLFSFALLM